jgi:hypothetical protein
MSRTDCPATHCHTPEERTPQVHRCGSLKTCQLTHCTSTVIQKRQPTNCMGQTPSWKATSWTASQTLSQFYSSRKFVTMLTIIRHWSSWATWNQSTPSQPVVWEYILVLFSLLRLGLPVVPFIQSSPPKHSMPSVPHAEYKSCGSPLCSSTTSAAIQCYLHQLSYILYTAAKVFHSGQPPSQSDMWHIQYIGYSRSWEDCHRPLTMQARVKSQDTPRWDLW